MASIRAFGQALPERVVTSAELAALLGVEEAWIESACGIRERRWLAPGQTASDLALTAAGDCLDRCGFAASDLGGVIAGSGSAPRQFPGISADVLRGLGLVDRLAFDVPLASAGGLLALALATDLAPRHGPLLVVGAEAMSTVLARAPLQKETAILFGDGAAACLVHPDDGPLQVDDVRLATDASFADALALPHDGPLQMEGRTVILQANRKLQAVVRALLEKNGLAVDAISLWVFHQANRNLLRQVGQALKIDPLRVFLNLTTRGNTSAAAVLLAAADAHAAGLFRSGERVVMAAFGAGFTAGAVLLTVR